MCDYSLTCVSNRLAEDGEELVVHRFYTGSKGLTAPDAVPAGQGLWDRSKAALRRDSVPAVCIPPGAELRLAGIPRTIRQWCGVGEVEDVRFVARSANAYEHRDAIRFRNGKVLPLQLLEEGVRATVLCGAGLPARAGELEPGAGRSLVPTDH
jgi:hypothetical protein